MMAFHPRRRISRLRKRMRHYAALTAAGGLFLAIRIWFLRLIRWSRPVDVTLRGLPLRVRLDSPDLGVALGSLGAEFLPLEHLLDRDYDGVIVDAGGYIGTAAMKFAIMYPLAKIVTVEPSRENLDLLTHNIAPYPNITAIHAALHPSSGQRVTLFDRGTGEWGNTIIANPVDCRAPASMGSVETISLASIADRFGREIGLLKLDIEGGEKALFDSPDQGLAAIPFIFTELHDKILPGCFASFREFSRSRLILRFGGEKYLSASRAWRAAKVTET